MRVNQTDYSVIPISEKALLGKIDKIFGDCSELNQYPLTLFKSHVDEIRRQVSTRLSDSASAVDPILKQQYYLFSWLSVWLLSDQIEKFTLVRSSIGNSLWGHLNTVIDDLARRLKLGSKPLPFFGSSFYCTGSFVYTEYGIQVSPFYQVSTESHESILFWPLLAHELAHLKLNESNVLDDLGKQLTRKNLKGEKYRERLEETVCDIIGAISYGPAYIASFGTKFWQLMDQYQEEDYPSNQFRLLTMFKALDEQNQGPSIDVFKSTFKVNDRVAKKEEISFLTDEMIELGKSLVESPADIDDAKIIDFCNKPNTIFEGRLDYLFNTLWLMIYQGAKTYNDASIMATSLLERWTKRSHSTTKR
jgi:hypothetical protein